MNRETYREAFDAIPFSPDFEDRTRSLLRQTVRETETEERTMKFRKPKKLAALIAAAVALLAVSVSAANLDTLRNIVLDLQTTFFVSGETEDGSFAAIRVPEVTLADRESRVILTVEGQETDVTDALAAEGYFSLEQTEEDGRLLVEVTGTPEDCACTLTGYREGLETPLFTVTYGKNETVSDADISYSVAEDSIQIDGSTLTGQNTVTLTKDDEFVVGHYDGEDIYGLVTDDPTP